MRIRSKPAARSICPQTKQVHPATCGASWPSHYLRHPRMQFLFPHGASARVERRFFSPRAGNLNSTLVLSARQLITSPGRPPLRLGQLPPRAGPPHDPRQLTLHPARAQTVVLQDALRGRRSCATLPSSRRGSPASESVSPLAPSPLIITPL